MHIINNLIYPMEFKNPDLWDSLKGEMQGANRSHAQWHGEDL